MPVLSELLSRFDPASGQIEGATLVQRTLSDLRGYFADERAYDASLAGGDPLLYTVAAVEPDQGDGALHYAIGRIMPGRIGDEYYMTKGHFHAWRSAAEYYIGLRGSGVMLLEDESGEQSRLLSLTPDSALYVPGHTAHRTINTGDEPLVYLGIYPAQSGHDYGSIADRNFGTVVVAHNGAPVQLDRQHYLSTIS